MTLPLTPSSAAGALAGKTVLITAAAQGIGRASALACLAAGAEVIATDLAAPGLDSLREEAGAAARLRTAPLDVRDDAAIQALARQLPRLQGLFNCAGFVHHGSVLDCDESAWDFSMDLNVKSMWRMLRAFLPGMLAEAERTGGASVLNMASMASSVKGFPNRCVYGVSKAAVIGLTKSVAADFVKQGLRCNALCPGTVDTPSLRGRIAAAADPAQAERDFIARQPMGRLATVDDIAPLVVFLLSDASRFITDQAVSVDGGVTI